MNFRRKQMLVTIFAMAMIIVNCVSDFGADTHLLRLWICADRCSVTLQIDQSPGGTARERFHATGDLSIKVRESVGVAAIIHRKNSIHQ